MFTWNLPALTRNAMWFTLFCIAVNWNFMAWLFLLFVVFVEMDEELTKYETYSDYFTDQLRFYEFINVNRNGWNLEEQLRIFNQQNPEVIQEYQRTFHGRLQELRKRPTKTKPQDKDKIKFNKKEQIRVKQEVFGYTENYWDEPDPWPTNEFVEVMNHLSSLTMYEWYHPNGLVISEQEYGIKNLVLYHTKYGDKNLDQEYQNIIKHNISEFYKIQMNEKNKTFGGLYTPVKRDMEIQKGQKLILHNNLLYWSMADHQKIQYNQYYRSVKMPNKYLDTRINHIQHIKSLSNKSYNQFDNQLLNQKYQTINSVYKQTQLPLQVFKKRYKKPLRLSRKNSLMSKIKSRSMARANQKKSKI